MVAERLFAQQPWKLWVMSMAVLGKQGQWSSQFPRPRTGSDVGYRSRGLVEGRGRRKTAGSSRIRAGESLEVSTVNTGKLRP